MYEVSSEHQEACVYCLSDQTLAKHVQRCFRVFLLVDLQDVFLNN